MKKAVTMSIMLLAILMPLTVTCLAEENKIDIGDNLDFGNKLGFEFGTGIQGIFSYYEGGILLPKINDHFSIGIKARYLSSLTYATYIDINNNDEYVSFHPSVIGGVISLGGCSPIVRGFTRAYGSFDLLLGYSFTPWDNLINNTGNLIGDNITYGLFGSFGIEFFTGDNIAIFISAGGGLKSYLSYEENNLYASSSAWLGSGVGINIGINFYRKK